MNPHPAPGAGRLARRSVTLLATVAAFVAVTAAVSAAARGAGSGAVPKSGTVFVAAGSVATVDLVSVPGQLTIVGAATGRVTLSGPLDWTGHSPAATIGFAVGRTLRLLYRCAAASPCTADWRLVVPWRTAVVLRQPAGHVVMSGLAGPLQIIAGSVDVSATGLRCPSLSAAITSGHLGATFDTAPRRVSVALRSAQATVWLPAGVAYAVSGQVTDGYLHAGIPQAAAAPRTVTARIVSGELDLLTR
jgi:hypothetical protein